VKLFRHGEPGHEKPGLLGADGRRRDLSGVVDDISPHTLADEQLERLRALDPASLPEVGTDVRLGPPVSPIRKIVCIGLNYSDHAAESGMAIPAEPVVFMKADTSICGPHDDVILPRDAHKTDWEVELGVIIGREARYVDEADALSHVAGYCVVNDVSERALQLEGTGQWTKGKSHDGFCPLGPVLTTRDEVPDPQALDLWLDLDGERVQTGNTGLMIFSLAHVIAYLSRLMTLRPGDLISTGTPPGVGAGMKPPRFLEAGQRMRLGIQGLGDIEHVTIREPER